MTAQENMTPPVPEDAGKPSRRQVLFGAAALGVAAVAGGGLLEACSTGTNGTGGGKGTDARHQTLFVAGFQWGPPQNFNPANPNAVWPTAVDQMQLVYETLVGFDLRDGSLKPHLAASLDTPDPKTIVVKMQPDAKWADGQPVGADDVVYTYKLGKTHPEVPWSSIWTYLSDVTKTDDKTVTFALNPSNVNPGIVKANLSTTPILPSHLWTGYESANQKIVEFTNTQPVGSGPYKLESFNTSQVKYVRDDNYWGKSVHGKVPPPKWIVHPIFKDNAAGDLALQQAQVDVSQQFTPQIWKMWQDKHLPVATWFDKPPYHLPGSIPMMVINTTKPVLSNPKVRIALAHAIDYARIAATAMSQYSDPANASVILPTGAEQQYFDAAAVQANGWKYDPDKAKSLLQAAGNPKLGPWTMQTPTGWSDWQAALNIVVENLKAIGVDIKANFPDAPVVTTAVQNANFDIAIWYIAGAGPAAPWQRFRDVLDSRGVPKPGTSAFYNYGRFSHPQVAGLLDKAATASGDELKGLFKQLDDIYRENAPMIPLMYRPLDFFENNATVWTGFPSAKNPTGPPTFRGDGIAWLYGLSAKSK
jgi:peptide/nickel transport system substrate-binding protein